MLTLSVDRSGASQDLLELHGVLVSQSCEKMVATREVLHKETVLHVELVVEK